MPLPTKPCAKPDCATVRYANLKLCYEHYRAAAKAKRLAQIAKVKERDRTLREKLKQERAERAERRRIRTVTSQKYTNAQRKGVKKKLDEVFSKLIRSHGKCERCGETDYARLQCSHIFPRSNLSVRWDPMNGKCLCGGCHMYFWHKEPILAMEWLATVRSPEHLAELKRRAHEVKKWRVPELIDLLAALKSRLAEAEKGF